MNPTLKFLALLLAVIVVVGCVAQPSSQPRPSVPKETAASESPAKAPVKLPVGKTVTPNDTVNTVDSKTGVEKTQDAIALAVADGLHEQQVTYRQPVGPETLDISVTVKGDVIEALSITGNGSTPTSKRMIEGVSRDLPGMVIGKKITGLNLPKQVAGSSLTTGAVKQYLNDLATGKAN